MIVLALFVKRIKTTSKLAKCVARYCRIALNTTTTAHVRHVITSISYQMVLVRNNVRLFPDVPHITALVRVKHVVAAPLVLVVQQETIMVVAHQNQTARRMIPQLVTAYIVANLIVQLYQEHVVNETAQLKIVEFIQTIVPNASNVMRDMLHRAALAINVRLRDVADFLPQKNVSVVNV